jgi:Cu-Zn family superoxide dismutase
MRITRIAVAAVVALASGTALAQDSPGATAMFVDAEGEPNGSAALTGLSQGVLIEVEVSGLPASQWVAFHVHETGSCDPATDHESAGGHFNPTSAQHGYRAAEGPHAGDMPNQHVGEDGMLRAQVVNTMVDLGDGDAGIVGRALMVHAEADDYESQPSGAAGGRLACGVIE